jgi:PAS domain-containing protein
MPREEAIVMAATRFQLAWEKAMARDGEGLIVADLDIVEVHEAALELIGVTETQTLEEALAFLHAFDPDEQAR